MLRSLVDTALDRAIVPGYTRLGYRVRKAGWPDDPAAGSLAGRTAVVTGANSGLGRATAAGLARLGARVHMVVRDPSRGETARREIAGTVPGADLRLQVCDVSDLPDVRRLAERLLEAETGLDVLVHNAGVFPPRREVTAQGHETAFATHVLGPHLLTRLLSDSLRAAEQGSPGRVVWVSSGGMYAQKLPEDDLEYERGTYRGGTAYARTKRMQVVLAERWAAELPPGEVVVHSTHPGWADTPGVARSLPKFRALTRPLIRSPEEGADTTVWLCAAPEPGRCTGGFWHDRRRRPTHYLPLTREGHQARDRLWAECERLTAGP